MVEVLKRMICCKGHSQHISLLPFVWFFRVSEEQCERIQDRRTRIKSLLAEVGESLRLVRDLQKSSEVRGRLRRRCTLFNGALPSVSGAQFAIPLAVNNQPQLSKHS